MVIPLKNTAINSSSSKGLTKSIIWSFLEQGGSKAVALIVQIILARLLSPEAFGLLAIMLVIVDIASVISQSGLGTALIQSKALDDRSCSTAFWLSIAISLVLYIGVFLASPIIASFYGMPDLTRCLQVIAISIPLHAVASIQRSILQADMNFKATFKSNMMAVAISGVAGIICAVLGMGIWALVVQTLVQSLMACVAMAFLVPWKPSLAFDMRIVKMLVSYGWKICVAGVLNSIYTGVSELIIGKACDAGQLGYYSQGRKWPIAGISIVTNAVSNVAFPAFAQIREDEERLRSAIRKALSVGNFIMVPFCLFFCVSAESLVLLLLGENWLPCTPVFSITCAAYSILMLQLVNLRAYMALGDSAIYLKLQVIKVLVSGLTIWSVAALTADIYCTAVANSLCVVLCILLFDLAPAQRIHGVGRREQIAGLLPTFGSALVATAAAWLPSLVMPASGLLLIAQIILFTGVYLGGAKVLKTDGLDGFLSVVKGLIRIEKKGLN